MTDRPAHGGYPGEVLPRREPPSPFGSFVPLGDHLVHVAVFEDVPAGILAAACGVSEEDVRAAADWTGPRHRTPGLQA